MNLRFSFYLGWRNLANKNGRLSAHLLGSIVGIGLSLVPLVVVLEVADGMIQGITRRYLEVGTYHLQLRIPGEGGLAALRSLEAEARDAPEVRNTVIERQGMGLLSLRNSRIGVRIRSVSPSLYREDEDFRKYFILHSGNFDLESPDSILLGREVASALSAEVGDRVKILTALSAPGSAGENQRSLPKVSAFEVKGIFSTGYQELDKLWVYIPLETGVRILSEEGSRQFLGLKLEDPFQNLEHKAESLAGILGPGVRIETWYELERANYKSFQTTKILLLFIMAMIVVVASVNISSALVMVVLEKNHEIGILKAIGAHPGEVRMGFLFTGFITGLAGTLLGLCIGLLIAVNINEVIAGLERTINLLLTGIRAILSVLFPVGAIEPVTLFNTAFYLEKIPIRIGLVELVYVAVLSLLLSTAAAYLPARRAGRIKPLEVLHKY